MLQYILEFASEVIEIEFFIEIVDMLDKNRLPI